MASSGPVEKFDFYREWIAKPEADQLYERCLAEIPWAPKKWNTFYTLPQLAYYYDEKQRKNHRSPIIESLIEKIEGQFQTSSSVVWCNLFESGQHYIDWHQDQYGEHLYVLSFGATRLVQFQHKKSGEMKDYYCKHGDLYYFSPQWDKTHRHRVVKDDSVTERRVSFAVFTQPPFSDARR